MNHIPIKIPVKPHIKAFLEFHFSEQYVLSLNDFLGLLLFHLLKKQSGIYKTKPTIQKAVSNYKEIFEVKVPVFDYFHLTVSEVNYKTIIDFNNMIDKFMDFNFQSFISEKPVKAKYKTKADQIRAWMDGNGLSEDQITEDAFIKAYYRFRKKGKVVRLVEF